MAEEPPLPQNFIDKIKEFEGFTPDATYDVNGYRNGYGTNALHPKERIDRNTAVDRLHRELGKAAAEVDARYPGLPPSHRAALTSLTFNAGSGWMNQGLGKAVAAGDWHDVRDKMMDYDHSAGKVLPALTDRRGVEASWMYGDAPPPGEPVAPPKSPSDGLTAPPSGNLLPFQGLFGTAPGSGTLPTPGVPGIAPAGMPEVASAPAARPAGLMNETDAAGMKARVEAAQKALEAGKDDEGKSSNSSKLTALANQLMTASQQKPTFSPMQLQPMNTGPFRPLPITLPPNFGTGR